MDLQSQLRCSAVPDVRIKHRSKPNPAPPSHENRGPLTVERCVSGGPARCDAVAVSSSRSCLCGGPCFLPRHRLTRATSKLAVPRTMVTAPMTVKNPTWVPRTVVLEVRNTRPKTSRRTPKPTRTAASLHQALRVGRLCRRESSRRGEPPTADRAPRTHQKEVAGHYGCGAGVSGMVGLGTCGEEPDVVG